MKLIGADVGLHDTCIAKMLWRKHGYRARKIRPLSLNIPTDAGSLGYVAGIIDGEGSIITGMKHTPTHFRIVVGITDKEVIDFLAAIGGRQYAEQPADPNHKTMHRWVVARQRDVRAILEAVLPYMQLRTKREKAEKAIASISAMLE